MEANFAQARSANNKTYNLIEKDGITKRGCLAYLPRFCQALPLLRVTNISTLIGVSSPDCTYDNALPVVAVSGQPAIYMGENPTL
jgi:hypothetical protein